jgi:hypothetical protein
MDRRDFRGVPTAMGAEAVCAPAVAASDAYLARGRDGPRTPAAVTA